MIIHYNKKRLGKKSSTTLQSSCQHLSAVVDWQICSCFTLQIWPNQLCGGGKTNSFLTSRVLSHSLQPVTLKQNSNRALSASASPSLIRNWGEGRTVCSLSPRTKTKLKHSKSNGHWLYFQHALATSQSLLTSSSAVFNHLHWWIWSCRSGRFCNWC